MQGEWMFAGDWYRMDDDGFYWYEGRADDMIKVSGLWVSPVEVEDTLGDHGSVMEAAAVGVPVDGLTRVKAFVVLARWLPGLRRTGRGVADLVQGEPQAVPVPAHSRVYRGAAEDGDGQDPTLQAPRARDGSEHAPGRRRDTPESSAKRPGKRTSLSDGEVGYATALPRGVAWSG